MAIRDDFTIDWETSPRLITVAYPSIEVTQQDLLDTLRWMEAEPTAMDDASIVDASGKEPLGGGTKVGLTVSLLNALIGFEARDGTEHGGINEWTLCNLLGGNLVAFDISGNVLDSPLHNTPFVNIGLTSSSSATLQEQGALQYASYSNFITIDAINGEAGTEFPIGTLQFPCNNVQDATSIAHEKGFSVINVIGDLTLSDGDTLDNFKIKGQSVIRTNLHIESVASVLNTEIVGVTLSGTLDGSAIILDTLIDGIEYVSGYMDRCGLTILPIILSAGTQATLINCFSNVSGSETPTVDMGGTGQSLAIRDYSGGIRIVNRTSNDPASVDMDSGHVIIDASCTGDPITLRGTFKLTVEPGATYPDVSGRVMMGSEFSNVTVDNVAIAREVWSTKLPLIETSDAYPSDISYPSDTSYPTEGV